MEKVKKTKKEEESMPVETQRRMKGEMDVYHDLFKLETAVMKKNIGLPGQKPLLEAIDHQHFYHSVNSRGKTQNASSPIGGHSHKIKVHKNQQTGQLEATCSPPFEMRTIKLKNGMRVEREMPCLNDDHTHKVTYMHSSVFKVKQVNDPQALNYISRMTSPDRPEDVQHGQQD